MGGKRENGARYTDKKTKRARPGIKITAHEHFFLPEKDPQKIKENLSSQKRQMFDSPPPRLIAHLGKDAECDKKPAAMQRVRPRREGEFSLFRVGVIHPRYTYTQYSQGASIQQQVWDGQSYKTGPAVRPA